MTPYIPGDRLAISDAAGTLLGTAVLDTVEGSIILGTFRRAPGFGSVAELFRRFEEHVEAAALAVLPEIEKQIASLGLTGSRPGEPGVLLADVQIYSDGGFSCKPLVPVGGNGLPANQPGITA
jgi:hypothetical protein